ncbi:MAG: hypothetical protein ACXWJV_07440 [Hyphomicrobium sp.]|jgi:hypothetical protein
MATEKAASLEPDRYTVSERKGGYYVEFATVGADSEEEGEYLTFGVDVPARAGGPPIYSNIKHDALLRVKLFLEQEFKKAGG